MGDDVARRIETDVQDIRSFILPQLLAHDGLHGEIGHQVARQRRGEYRNVPSSAGCARQTADWGQFPETRILRQVDTAVPPVHIAFRPQMQRPEPVGQIAVAPILVVETLHPSGQVKHVTAGRGPSRRGGIHPIGLGAQPRHDDSRNGVGRNADHFARRTLGPQPVAQRGGNEIHVGITSLPVFAVETRRFGIGDKFHLLARQHVAPPLADHPVYGRIGAGSYRGKRRSPVGGHIIVTGRGKGDPAFGQTAEPALGKVMAVTGDEIIGQPPDYHIDHQCRPLRPRSLLCGGGLKSEYSPYQQRDQSAYHHLSTDKFRTDKDNTNRHIFTVPP